MKKIYTLALLFILPLFASAQIYVDVDATGSNNGSSWGNAYTDLQSALSDSSLEEIWVAEGTYMPSLQDTMIYFSFLEAHDVYGGFNGTETALSERDPAANLTVIEGDINGDDVPNNFGMNKSDNATHLFYIPEGFSSVVIDGFNFQGGTTLYTNDMDAFSWRGGAIYALSPINVSNCSFTNNAARSGGCIYVSGTTGTSITDCNISNNYAVSQAAGIILDGSVDATISDIDVVSNLTNRGSVYVLFADNIAISNINFLNNSPNADSWGCSGLQNYNSINITLSDCTFEGNTGGNASSVYVDGSYNYGFNMTVNNCTFESNTTSAFGGTFYAWRGDYIMNDCVFNNNSGPNAAAVYNGNATAQINNTEFSINTATFGGATANYSLDTDVTYTGCTFFNNMAATSGGACMVGFQGKADFVDCTFESNQAQWGGAFYIQTDSTFASFSGCHFLANESDNFGGALASFDSSPLSFSDCNFELNKSEFGGALSVVDDTLYLSTVVIDKCKFNFNTAFLQGGALNFGNTDATITSSLFSFNNAQDLGNGGCISNNSSNSLNSTVTLVNSTLSENTGALAGGIAQFEDGTPDANATVFVQNSIIYNLFGDDYAVEEGDPEIITMGGNLVYQADLANEFTSVNDEIGSNPLFTDATAFDFTLQEASPAINTGIASGAPTTDINGDPLLDEVDKGCYEFQGIIESTDNLLLYSQTSLINNPAKDFTILQIENEYVGDLNIEILDATGKQFYNTTFQKSIDLEQFTIPVADLVKGTYFVRIVAGNSMASKRLIKM